EQPTMSMADMFKARLGWKPSQGQPFHTSANRECGDCRAIKPGSEFDTPVTPGRPDLNICRECSV
ncbi:hypothetical protein, partial [Mycobacterium sp.]